MPYKDKSKQSAYQVEWMRKRRQEWIESQGAKCAQCGRVDLPFEVDHVDKTTKVSHRIWSWSKSRREAELEKCQLLCNLCHYQKTGKENSNEEGHHGDTEYHKGCRCDVCKLAHNSSKQKWRAMRKSKGLPAT